MKKDNQGSAARILAASSGTVFVDKHGGAEFTAEDISILVGDMVRTDTPQAIDEFCDRFVIKDEAGYKTELARLQEIADVMDELIGDSDPHTDLPWDAWDDEEIKSEFPLFWCYRQLNAILKKKKTCGL